MEKDINIIILLNNNNLKWYYFKLYNIWLFSLVRIINKFCKIIYSYEIKGK